MNISIARDSRFLISLWFFTFFSVVVRGHGDVSDRIDQLNHQIEHDPNNLGLYFKRGKLYLDEDHYIESRKDLSHYIETFNQKKHSSPDKNMYLDAKYRLGKSCLLLTDIPCARLHTLDFLAASTNANARGRANMQLGAIALAANQNTKAFRYYQQAVNLFKNPEPRLFVSLADVGLLLGEREQRSALRALELSTNTLGNVPTLMERAIVLARSLKDWTKAQDTLIKMLEPSKGFRRAVLLNMQGDIWMEAKNNRAAKVSWQLALATIEMLPSKKRLLAPIISLEEELRRKHLHLTDMV